MINHRTNGDPTTIQPWWGGITPMEIKMCASCNTHINSTMKQGSSASKELIPTKQIIFKRLFDYPIDSLHCTNR